MTSTSSTSLLPPPAEQTYDNALSALLSPLHQSQTPDDIRRAAQRRTKTPSDMREYLSRICLPHDSDMHCKNIVHITGTKGKGSTAAICESILRVRDGLTTGLFTSPHLVDIRERIRIHGKPVSKEVFGAAYWEIRKRLADWKQSNTSNDEDDDNDGLPFLPGYFRMLALMATFIFAHYVTTDGAKIDVVILEVGVGGRYDATNIFDHSTTNTVCGVTLIDYDHTRVLGSALTQIAWEKGGIFHANKKDIVDAFTAEFDDSKHNITHNITGRPTEENAEERTSKDNELARDQIDLERESTENARFFTIESNSANVAKVLRSCAGKEGNGEHLSIVQKGDAVQSEWKIGLPGVHQRINAELAVALCDALNKRIIRLSRSTPSQEATLEEALEQTFWPGRCQTAVVEQGGRRMNVRCDGAHTPQSLATCLKWFRTVSGYDDGSRRSRYLLFNCSHERNPVPLLDMIQSIDQPKNTIDEGEQIQNNRPLFDQVYFCRADSERPSALKKSSARELLQDAGILEKNEMEGEAEEQETEGATWQDTLAEIWMDLAAHKGGSLLEIPCVVNVNVAHAMAIIKQCIETDPLHKLKNNNDDEAKVEICVTGSLYMVGSVLNAAEWTETTSDGHLEF